MHYFSFNIKKYRNKTGHLSNDEDLAYRRLLEEYYDTEAPIPVGTQSVARRLRLGDKVQIVDSILHEFFVIGADNCWHHDECDQVIADYHAMSKRNKNNGMKGGRKSKKKVKTQSEPSRNPSGRPTNNQ